MAYMGSSLLFFDIKSSAIIPYLKHFKPAIALVVMVIIILNFKGQKTKIAILIASLGLTLIVLQTYLHLNVLPPLFSYVLFIIAVGYNANFSYLYNYFKIILTKKLGSTKTIT